MRSVLVFTALALSQAAFAQENPLTENVVDLPSETQSQDRVAPTTPRSQVSAPLPTTSAVSEKRASESEYFKQLGVGSHSLVVTPSSNSVSQNYTRFIRNQNETRDLKYETKTNNLNLGYQGAIGSNWNVGLAASYVDSIEKETLVLSYPNFPQYQTITSEYKNKGMSDIELSASGISKNENFNVLYGTKLFLSPVEMKMSDVDVEGNAVSGGQALQPFVGIEKGLGRAVVGATAAYRIQGERKYTLSDENGGLVRRGSYKGQDETLLAAFTELRISDSALGLAFNYSGTAFGTEVIDNNNYTMAEQSSLTGRIYGRVSVTNAFDILPTVTYGTALTKNKAGKSNEDKTAWNASIAARLFL